MRQANLVLAIAHALAKRLGHHVSVAQTDRYTEWRVGDCGFAVGPHPENYPPRALLDILVGYFSKRLPREKDGHTKKRSDI